VLKEKHATHAELQSSPTELTAQRVKMDKETKLTNSQITDLMKKDWPTSAAVKKLQGTIDTQKKAMSSLKGQLELKDKQRKDRETAAGSQIEEGCKNDRAAAEAAVEDEGCWDDESMWLSALAETGISWDSSLEESRQSEVM